jgi:hypothetical protein
MEEYNKINEKYLKIADEKLSFLNDNDKKFVINFLDKIEKAS